MARVAVLSIAVALAAGACASASGDPGDTLANSEVTISYGGERAPVGAVDQAYEKLPRVAWARSGAQTSYATGRFDVSDFGAIADDGNEDAWAFAEAIDAATEAGGGVVVIPAGTFLLQDTVELSSNVTLRGVGPDTRLELDLQDQSGVGIKIAGSAEDDWTRLDEALPAGAELVAVPLPVGATFVEIEQDNTEQMHTLPKWDVEWGAGSEGEMLVVAAYDNAGRAVLSSPTVNSYSTQRNAQVRAVDPIQNAGVESLTILRVDEGYGHTISMEFALDVWVSDVVSERTSFAHVGIEQTARCTISDNILFDATDFGDGGRAYGISLARHTTGCVIVNNTLYDLRHAIIVQLGASGNVVAYNHARGSAGYEDRRPRADISLHGHWPQRNLFEGNIVDRIEVADWWGPAGPDNTFLRNCVLDHVIVLDSSERQTFAGNLVGVGGITIDPSVTATSLITNVSLVDGAVVGSESDSDSASSLPVSMWRSDAPQFLGSQWPPINPLQDSPSCDLPASSRSPLGNR